MIPLATEAKVKNKKLECRFVFVMERSDRGGRPILGEVLTEQPFSRAHGTRAIREVETRCE